MRAYPLEKSDALSQSNEHQRGSPRIYRSDLSEFPLGRKKCHKVPAQRVQRRVRVAHGKFLKSESRERDDRQQDRKDRTEIVGHCPCDRQETPDAMGSAHAEALCEIRSGKDHCRKKQISLRGVALKQDSFGHSRAPADFPRWSTESPLHKHLPCRNQEVVVGDRLSSGHWSSLIFP